MVTSVPAGRSWIGLAGGEAVSVGGRVGVFSGGNRVGITSGVIVEGISVGMDGFPSVQEVKKSTAIKRGINNLGFIILSKNSIHQGLVIVTVRS
jgi:hypothetical protein